MTRTTNHLSTALLSPTLARVAIGIALAIPAWSAAPRAQAAESAAHREQALSFSIPAQPLEDALNEFIAVTDWQVGFAAGLAKDARSPGVSGRHPPAEALRKLLAGTGLVYRHTGARAVTLKRAPEPIRLAAAEGNEVRLAPVTVKDTAMDENDPYDPSYTRTNAATATKTDTPIMENPMSIQVVPQAVLKDQQAFRLQDAVKNVSGVQQYSTNGGTLGGNDTFVVRGFELGNIRYRNGIRIAGNNADFANLDRIEVLKGPASGLYGRIEPGGLINVVTKKPLTEPYYSLEQRFGSYDYYRTEANATGPLTQDGSLAYRLDLSYLDTKSFRDLFVNDRIFVAPAISWKPSDSTEFNLSVEYLHEDRTYDAGIPVIGNRIAPVPISRSFTQKGLADNNAYWLIDFNWSHHFNENWKLRNGVLATEVTSTFEEVYVEDRVAPNGDATRGAWFGGGDNDLQTVYLDLTGKFETFGIRHKLLIGADYYHYRDHKQATSRFVDNINIFKPLPKIDLESAKGPPYLWNSIQTNEWYGVYFQDEMTLWDKLHIMGGGRYDIATFGSGSSDQNLAQARSNFTDFEENYFSPRVGILYQPWEWLSLYGHFVESFGANNGQQISGKPFDPQTSTEFEGGIKTSFFDGRLIGTLAYYHLTKQNVLTPDPNNRNLLAAIGEARSRGVELDISGRLTDGLSMIGTYAYTDTEVTKDNSGNQGNRLPYVPLHSGSFWLKYDFQQDVLNGLSIGAGVYAAGRRYGDAANSFSDGAYARLDLMAAYRFNVGPTRLTAQVNIHNVTDTEYFIQRAAWSNNPAEPLMVFGSLRLEL